MEWNMELEGLTSRGALAAFEIAGADHKFVPATAKIDGEDVVVSAPGVAWPVYVRYAWDNAATDSPYNAAGLPVEPLRSSRA